MAQIKDTAHDEEGKPINFPETERLKVPEHPADHYVDAARAFWRLGKAKAQNRIQREMKTAWAESINGQAGFMLEINRPVLVRELWPKISRDEVRLATASISHFSPNSVITMIPGRNGINGVIWFADEWLDGEYDNYTPLPGRNPYRKRAVRALTGSRIAEKSQALAGAVKGQTVAEVEAQIASQEAPREPKETATVETATPVTQKTQESPEGFSVGSFMEFLGHVKVLEDKAKAFENFKSMLRELLEQFSE